MTGRQRKLRYGAAVALLIVGVTCGAVIPGATGGTLSTAFVGLGLLGVVSLIFYEVGLSEDRDRARQLGRADGGSRRPPSARSKAAGAKSEAAGGEPEAAGAKPEAVPPARRRPSRPDRMRGQRRRLR